MQYKFAYHNFTCSVSRRPLRGQLITEVQRESPRLFRAGTNPTRLFTTQRSMSRLDIPRWIYTFK